MLGMHKVFIHRFAGILSAYGLGLADIVEEFQVSSNNLRSAKMFIWYINWLPDIIGTVCDGVCSGKLCLHQWSRECSHSKRYWSSQGTWLHAGYNSHRGIFILRDNLVFNIILTYFVLFAVCLTVQPYLDLRYDGTDTILRTAQPSLDGPYKGELLVANNCSCISLFFL